MKDAKCAESNGKSSFQCLFFELSWKFIENCGLLCTKMTITGQIKIGKIDFSFISAYCASSMKMGANLREGVVCISSLGTGPSLIFPFHLLPSPVHYTGFSYRFFPASLPFLSCHRATTNYTRIKCTAVGETGVSWQLGVQLKKPPKTRQTSQKGSIEGFKWEQLM